MLAKLQLKLDDLKDERRRLENEQVGYNKQYKIGLWAILIGLGIAFVINAWVGGFFVVIGLLATITNAVKRSGLNDSITNVERSIQNVRQQIMDSD